VLCVSYLCVLCDSFLSKERRARMTNLGIWNLKFNFEALRSKTCYENLRNLGWWACKCAGFFGCLFVWRGGEGWLCVGYMCVLCDSFFEQGEARENDESRNLKFEIQK
jgi:hypothetical protein